MKNNLLKKLAVPFLIMLLMTACGTSNDRDMEDPVEEPGTNELEEDGRDIEQDLERDLDLDEEDNFDNNNELDNDDEMDR